MTTPGTPPKSIRFPQPLADEIVAAMRRRFGRRDFRPMTFTDWVLAAVKEKLSHMERSRRPRTRSADSIREGTTEEETEPSVDPGYEEFREWIEGPAKEESEEEDTEVEATAEPQLPKEITEMTARELLYCQFARVWERMAKEGHCDEVGGAEFKRVWEEYSTQLPTVEIEDFIQNRANVPAVPQPAPARPGRAKV